MSLVQETRHSFNFFNFPFGEILQKRHCTQSYLRERRMMRPVWASTSTQITRPFCMNFRR